jgi:hypothetical protein
MCRKLKLKDTLAKKNYLMKTIGNSHPDLMYKQFLEEE